MKNNDQQSPSATFSSSEGKVDRTLDCPLDHELDQLLASSPLAEPSAWFTTQTIARLRREQIDHERLSFRWIWSGICAVAMILIVVGVEIREQSQNEIFSLVSLENIDSLENEGLWLGQ